MRKKKRAKKSDARSHSKRKTRWRWFRRKRNQEPVDDLPSMHRCVSDEFDREKLENGCASCSSCGDDCADHMEPPTVEAKLRNDPSTHYGPSWTPPESKERSGKEGKEGKVGLSHIIEQGIQQFMDQAQAQDFPITGTAASKITLPGFHSERDPELCCELFDDGDRFTILADLTQFMPCKPKIAVKRRRCTVSVARDDKSFAQEIEMGSRIEPPIRYHIKNDILEIRLKKAN